jgi:tetratricopeptide (TPR) repeat protein
MGGGFGGGHMGGGYYGGGHMGGGFYGGSQSFGGSSMGGYSGGMHSGGQHSIGGMSGGTRGLGGSGLNGLGNHSGAGALHSTPSFTHSHAFSPLNGGSRTSTNTSNFLGSHGAGAATAHHGNSALGTSLGRNHASGLLNHQNVSHSGANAAHGGQFLSHHGTAGHHAGTGQTGTHHNTGSHLASMGNGHQFGNLHHGINNGFNNGFRHHGFNRNFFFFGGFGGWGWGWGWPWWGWGGWGWGYPGFGFGYGLSSLFGYGLLGLGYGYGGYGYGGYGGYGYGGYGYNPYCTYGYYPGYAGGYYYPGTAVVAADQQDNAVAANQGPAINPKTPAKDKDADNAKVFAEKGENDFKTRDYKSAAYAWKHAALDDPTNGVLVMMLAQAFFATGQFDEAAGAVQQGMQLLPKEEWGVVVKNYKELYTNIQDFTDQLRALEKAVKEKPNDPALRFLAGFEYAYLGFPKEAVDQLDKGLKAAPRDQMAKKLRDEMTSKLPKPVVPPAPAGRLDGDK